MPRKGQVRIAYSSTFATQSGFGSPLANSAIDAVFNLIPETVRFRVITDDDVIKDCTGQYKVDEVILARSSQLSFTVEVTLTVLWGLIKWAFGVVASNVTTMLGPTAYQPAATTLIYGHDGSSVDPLKLQDMVLNSFRLAGRIGARFTVEVEFRGHGNPPAATGYTFPDCSTITPVYMKDGAFTLNSVNRYADLRTFDLSYSNELISEEDPFTMASQDITRMERDDERQYGLSLKLIGEAGDTTDQAARSKTKWPFMLRIGPASGGIQIDAASAIIKQNGGPGYDGRANRSVLDLLAEPVRVPSNPNTPLKATLLP